MTSCPPYFGWKLTSSNGPADESKGSATIQDHYTTDSAPNLAHDCKHIKKIVWSMLIKKVTQQNIPITTYIFHSP